MGELDNIWNISQQTINRKRVEEKEIVILKVFEMPGYKTGNIYDVSFYLKNCVKFVIHSIAIYIHVLKWKFSHHLRMQIKTCFCSFLTKYYIQIKTFLPQILSEEDAQGTCAV